MIQLITFCKIPDSYPQRFLIVEKDSDKADRKGYMGRMIFPTEPELREAFKGRVSDAELDAWISAAPNAPRPEQQENQTISLNFDGMPQLK